MAEGTLDIEPSYVKVDSIYSVEKNIIRKVVARLKEEKIKEIKDQLLELFSQTDRCMRVRYAPIPENVK